MAARKSRTRRRGSSARALARLEQAFIIQREQTRLQAEGWLDANQQLEESLAIFKALYEDAPVGYLTLNEAGIVIDVNTRAAVLLDRDRRFVRGRPLLFFVDRSETDKLLRHLLRCRAGESLVSTELSFRLRHDRRIPVELVSRRTSLAGGRIAFQTVVNDLTERHEAERIVEASEKRYREIVETANEGICKVDASNRIRLVNRAFTRLVGRSEEELLGASFEDLVLPEDIDDERSIFNRREAGRGSVREQRLRRGDGSTVWTGVSTTVLVDSDGQFAGMLRSHNDITDGKELEAARENLVRHLVAAQEAERQRVARELHDQMGQHLVGLSLGLNRLAQLGSDSPEIAHVTQRLQSLAEVMARDVQHLAFQLRPASLDDLGLGDAVCNYADDVARQFGIEVDVQCDRMPRLDPNAETAIYRIVQEALTNVTKHARAQRVSVILEPRGDRLHVIVEDDGVGFTPEVVAHAHNGRRLGLRGMIERAALVGGEFQIESRPGRGTTLFLRVPLRRGEKADDEEATTAAG
jgi:PAS domain S-box-containing protein